MLLEANERRSATVSVIIQEAKGMGALREKRTLVLARTMRAEIQRDRMIRGADTGSR